MKTAVVRWLRTLGSWPALIITLLLFRLTLDVSYVLFVTEYYSYAGFTFDTSFLIYLESWVLLLLVGAFTPAKLKKPSACLVVILLCGFVLPLLSFYGLAAPPRQYVYMVVLGYIVISIFRHGWRLQIPTLKEGPWLAVALLCIGILSVVGWLVLSGAIQYFNLDFTEVYTYREQVTGLINTGAMGYVNTWAYKVFGPALLTIALWKRNYSLAALVVLFHVFGFGVSSLKAVFFYPFLIVFVWVWFRQYSGLGVIPVVLTGVVVVTIAVESVFDYGFAASLFVRRAFYVTARDAYSYYEFFGNHTFVWWSNTLPWSFVDYPYRLPPPALIGQWTGHATWVNNTVFANGYMHAGVYGVLAYSAVIAFIFWVIDSLTSVGVASWVGLAIVLIPCRSLLLSSDLPTSLVTHGVAIAIILLALLRSGCVGVRDGRQPGSLFG